MRISQKKTQHLLVVIAFFGALTSQTYAQSVPLVRLSSESMQLNKNKALHGDVPARRAIEMLDQTAEKLLDISAFSVVYQGTLADSGDPHDYFSLGPYWWPDPNKKDGKPWIRRDGEVNPISRAADQDKAAFVQFNAAVQTLSQAYFFTDKIAYAQKAAQLIRTWFLDEKTRMHPHLQYAQSIPGLNSGRGIGIIDMRTMYRVIDSIQLLKAAKVFSVQEQQSLKHWFVDYLTWLTTSPLGIEESNTTNNHASFYVLQTASIALYSGNQALAGQQIEKGLKLLMHQVDLEGRQALELARTKPFHYSAFNLQALVGIAALAPQAHHAEPTLKLAAKYLLTGLREGKAWHGKQELQVNDEILLPVLPELISAYQFDLSLYEKIWTQHPNQASQCALLFATDMPAVLPNKFELCAY
jgi:hypothetical protein